MYSLHCYPMWGNSNKYGQSTAEGEQQKNAELAVIWQKLIQQWNPNDRKLAKCARSMSKYGAIPSSLRPEAWFVISGAAQEMKKNTGLYNKLYRTKSDKADLIQKDLPRTWGSHPSFQERKGSQHSLRRILTAYSNFDPLLGYCQGMNYIAAFLLQIFNGSNEEQAFWVFVIMLKRIRSLFIDGLPGFHKIVHYFRKLCAYHLPKLNKEWDLLGIDVYKLILTPWFHSLFSYPCMDVSHTARIWDLFIVNDFSICVKIAFTVLASNEKKLMTMDFVDIIDFCKYLPCMKTPSSSSSPKRKNNKLNSGKQLMQKAIAIKLNDKYLNHCKDLSRFDWHKNKKLKKEYAKHKQKRLQKEIEKQKMHAQYKTQRAKVTMDLSNEDEPSVTSVNGNDDQLLYNDNVIDIEVDSQQEMKENPYIMTSHESSSTHSLLSFMKLEDTPSNSALSGVSMSISESNNNFSSLVPIGIPQSVSDFGSPHTRAHSLYEFKSN